MFDEFYWRSRISGGTLGFWATPGTWRSVLERTIWECMIANWSHSPPEIIVQILLYAWGRKVRVLPTDCATVPQDGRTICSQVKPSNTLPQPPRLHSTRPRFHSLQEHWLLSLASQTHPHVLTITTCTVIYLVQWYHINMSKFQKVDGDINLRSLIISS